MERAAVFMCSLVKSPDRIDTEVIQVVAQLVEIFLREPFLLLGIRTVPRQQFGSYTL